MKKILEVGTKDGKIITGFCELKGTEIEIIFSESIESFLKHVLKGDGNKIKDPSKLIASFLIRKYQAGDPWIYEYVKIYNARYDGLAFATNVVYPEETQKMTESSLVTVNGMTFDSNEKILIPNPNGGEAFDIPVKDIIGKKVLRNVVPDTFKYTKSDEVNKLLSLVGEPFAYTKGVAKLFSTTHVRIRKLKDLGLDVYYNPSYSKKYWEAGLYAITAEKMTSSCRQELDRLKTKKIVVKVRTAKSSKTIDKLIEKLIKI